METRSGELVSGGLSLSIGAACLTAPPEAAMFQILQSSNPMPEWAFIAAVCGVFCMFAAFYRNLRVQAAARMMSGCVWGSVVLLFGLEYKLVPMFWMAVVLFMFDVYAVTIKGQSWIQRSTS